MKIILDHNEYLWLQKIMHYDVDICTVNEVPVVKDLLKAGLIDQHIFDLVVTDLGLRVFEQHSPWMEEDNVHDKVRLDRMQVANDSQLYLTSLHETSRT